MGKWRTFTKTRDKKCHHIYFFTIHLCRIVRRRDEYLYFKLLYYIIVNLKRKNEKAGDQHMPMAIGSFPRYTTCILQVL